jgi:hypothetical protein
MRAEPARQTSYVLVAAVRRSIHLHCYRRSYEWTDLRTNVARSGLPCWYWIESGRSCKLEESAGHPTWLANPICGRCVDIEYRLLPQTLLSPGRSIVQPLEAVQFPTHISAPSRFCLRWHSSWALNWQNRLKSLHGRWQGIRIVDSCSTRQISACTRTMNRSTGVDYQILWLTRRAVFP